MPHTILVAIDAKKVSTVKKKKKKKGKKRKLSLSSISFYYIWRR